MGEWSRETVLKFVEVYESEPVIWDPKHLHHRDKAAVNDAWTRLADIMEISVAELKKKKESLMTTFRFHLKKKKASIMSGASFGDVYNPSWFAFQYMERFLGQIYGFDSTYNKQEIDAHQQWQSIGEEDQSKGEHSPSPASQSTPSPARRSKRPRRRSSHTPDFQEVNDQIKQTFNQLNSVLSQRHDREEDECDLYGRLLAKKLKRMSEDERDEVMLEIDSLIMAKKNRSAACSSQVATPNLSDDEHSPDHKVKNLIVCGKFHVVKQ